MATNTGELYINIKADISELKKGLNLANKQLSTFDQTMQRSATGVMNFAKSAVGIYAVGSAFKAALTAGFSYNTQLETTQQSITGLLVATSALVDENGNAITQQQLYNTAMGESAAILKDLQKINAQTPVTLNETAQIYKTMLPSMRQVGASQKDLMELTKNLAVASGVAGIKTAQLLAGIDGLADGTVLANSELGRFLRALGLTNDELKNSGDVVDLLNSKLGQLKGELTMTMQLSTLAEAWTSTWGVITEGLWSASKEWIEIIINFLNDTKQKIQNLPLVFTAIGMEIDQIWRQMLAGMTLAYEEFMDTVKTTLDYFSGFGMISVSFNPDLEDAKKAYDDISNSMKTANEHFKDLLKNQAKLPKSASTVASSLGTTSSKDAAKASKARIAAAKKEASALKKIEADLWKSLAKNHQSNLDLREKDLKDFADYSKFMLSGIFDSLIDGDLQGAFEGVFQSLLGTLTQFVAEAIVQTVILGQAFASTAIAHAAAQTTWVGLAAMTAAMVALGFAVNASGGDGGSSYAMPSYSQVSQGSSGESQTALNSEGAYLSLVDYNAILKIAEYNQTDFNAALGEYNNLVSEAHQIWESASASLRKWGREITDYNEALKATQSVGSFDALNEFFDTVATADEQIAYLSKTVDVLAADAGVAGLSIADMAEYIKYLISVGDQVSMAQANRIALLGNAQNELNEAVTSAAKSTSSCTLSLEDMAEAAEEAARAAKELRQGIAGLTADWMDSLEGSLLVLNSVIRETGLSGVNSSNFSSSFAAASGSAGFSQEDLDKWAELSDALKNYSAALEEKTRAELAAINVQITFYEGILSRIESAYSGSLSYFNSLEKIAYLGELAVTKFGAGDTQGYFNTLYSQLEHEKKMSATREDYTLSFESYILELKNAEPEATLDDVVDEIKESNIKLDNLTDAIAESSYQKA
ncbi:MAG: hypothetical protein J7L21_01450 [Sulfurimonas sp.]|nr:hypothetical protein [Sulfurimonas sp.]